MSLINALTDVFKKMKDDSDGSNQTFAQGVIEAVQASIESGNTAATPYLGTCSLGTSASTVIGNSTVVNAAGAVSNATSTMKNELDKMNDNEDASDDDWISAVVAGIESLINDTKVTEALSGTVVPPVVPPPTVPAVGTAEGTMSMIPPIKSALEISLKSIPAALGSTGDDSIMAVIMGSGILASIAGCPISFDGQGPLAGLSGANIMVGNI